MSHRTNTHHYRYNNRSLPTHLFLNRPGGQQQVTTVVHKPSSTDSSSSSSSRGLWRQQSVSTSLKFVSSKRHGRNIKMEQKATKVQYILANLFTKYT